MCNCTSLAPGPSLSGNKIAGWHWGEDLGSQVDLLFTGKCCNVGAGVRFYLILKLIIKVNKKNTDRSIDCLLEVLGLAITLKKRQRQAIKNCGWTWRVRYHAHWLWKILLLYAPSSSVWADTKHIQSPLLSLHWQCQRCKQEYQMTEATSGCKNFAY